MQQLPKFLDVLVPIKDACDDDQNLGEDNDYKAGGTRGPCCDNVWGVNVSI